MSDRLERFIKENKKQFDEFEAPSLLWDKIDASLNAQEKKVAEQVKMRTIYRVLKVAAVFVMVISAGYLLVAYQENEATKMSNINPDYAKKEIRFTSLIELKQEEIKDFAKQEPKLYKAFVNEQNKLEIEHKDLKQQLLNTPNQDRVVKAMIRNLQAQISLLNQQINVMEEVKQLKNNGNENQSI
jgi:hypothetical protein